MKRVDNIIFQDPKKTFMEILKVNNREIPFANLLAFFFRPNKEHGLGTLFIDSFLDTVQLNISDRKDNHKSVKIHVEKKTDKGNRIDILIITDTFVICIEFKINHHLNNPLEDYKDFIDKYPDCIGKQKYYFVLTPFRKESIGKAKTYFENNTDFKQIILSHFVQTIKKNLHNTIGDNHNKNDYYQHFEEFIQTVENRKIRSLRRKELTAVSAELNNKGLESKYHSNNQGGFIEILKGTNTLKIRIKSGSWQVEKWKDGVMISDEIKVEHENLIAKTTELTSSYLS
jgi:hypothetical protein